MAWLWPSLKDTLAWLYETRVQNLSLRQGWVFRSCLPKTNQVLLHLPCSIPPEPLRQMDCPISKLRQAVPVKSQDTVQPLMPPCPAPSFSSSACFQWLSVRCWSGRWRQYADRTARRYTTGAQLLQGPGGGDCCSAKWLCHSWNAVETFVNMKCLWFYFPIKINAKWLQS